MCDEASGTCIAVAVDGGKEGCSADADCAAPTARCDVASHTCVQCLADADCESGACAAGACLPFPDRCEVAQTLQLSATPTVVVSSTRNLGDDIHLACAAGEGAPDLVYDVVVSAPSRIHVSVTPTQGSALRPVLGLQSECGSESESFACNWASAEDGQAHLSVDVPAGHFYLWVDADYGTSGGFRLEASAVPATDGDSCAAPLPIPFVDGHASIDGHTDGLSDDYDALCGVSGGFGSPDVVYALTLEAPQRVQLSVTSNSEDFRPLVYLRRPDACARNASTTAELDCGEAFPVSGASIDIPSLGPGTYWLIVDGDLSPGHISGSSGDFHLEVDLLPPLMLASNDRCDGALPLALKDSGTVELSADTLSAFDDADSACGGTGPDVVYTFTLTEPRYFEARVTPSGSATFIPVLALRSACEDGAPTALVACNAAPKSGSAAVITHGALPAGTWYLWVDGDHQTRGAFNLQVTTWAPVYPPPNDTCLSPDPLPLSQGTAWVTGTTLGAGDDNSACEIPSGAASPDVVYAISIQSKSSISLDVEAVAGSNFRPVIYMEKGLCGQAGADRPFCVWGDPANPGRVVHTEGSLAPGLWHVWVDGELTTSGAFTLKATLGPPVPAPNNDDCATAVALPETGTTVSGDTRSANDSTFGTCELWETGSGERAGDVVYTFTTSATHDVSIEVKPDPIDGTLYRPVVYVRGNGSASCGDGDPAVQAGCAVASSLGGSATLSLTALPAGTWSVWVDGAGQTTGKFTLSLSLH